MITYSGIIEKKKHNIELSKDEIYFLVNNFIDDKIKDYQMSSFLMAVWFNSLSDDELVHLTQAMIDSGETYNLDELKDEIFVDKHSTGGVGDKTSLIFGPILAYLDLCVAKISGRGLAQTGGTIDKLESCKGWTGEISNKEFIKNLKNNKISLMGQSKSVVPADKLLYALRDVTGTVDSNVLIAASIMSKKLVVPSNCIILDVKVGDGAFMKDIESAEKLAEKMTILAKKNNRHLGILLSDMNKPLGRAIGNAIEVKEAYETLLGNGPDDLVELVSFACASALTLTKKRKDFDNAKQEVVDIMKGKKAAIFLEKMITSQGGDFSLIKDYDKNFSTKFKIEIKAKESGFVSFKSAYDMGILSTLLGAGRMKKEDQIDYAAGIYLNKQTGEKTEKNDIIMTLFTNIDDSKKFMQLAEELIIINKQMDKKPIILGYIKT